MTAFMNRPHLIPLDEATVTQAQGLASHLLKAMGRGNEDQADVAERRLQGLLADAGVPEGALIDLGNTIAAGAIPGEVEAQINRLHRRNR